MKQSFTRSLLAVLLALTTLASPALAAANGTGEPLYTNTQVLTDGFTYTNTISNNILGKRVETFSLETTPDSPVYPVVFAGAKVYDLTSPADMVAWAESQGLNVHALINADFFYGDRNLPVGGVISDGEYISSVNVESLLVLDREGAYVSDKPDVVMTLTNQGGGDHTDPVTGQAVSVTGSTVTVRHLNKLRTKTGGLFMYSPAYHAASTNTSRNGWAVRFTMPEDARLAIGGTMELTVAEVIPSGTDIPIGDHTLVLSSPSDGPYPEVYKQFAPGDRVTLTVTSTDERLNTARWATGCGDVLVRDGVLQDPAGFDKDISVERHPRTAIGIKPDGSVIAYVVDGRKSSYSNGAFMEEIGQDLLDRGASTVVNLDGGGSSVMTVLLPGDQGLTMVNKPSTASGDPRKVSTYILFVSDRTPDGVPARLHLKEEGSLVLAGSSLPLSFTATDGSGHLADVPEDITVTPGLGTVTEGVYTAGLSAGTDTVTLAAGDITGLGSLHVVDTVDTLTVTDAATGKAPSLSKMSKGQSVTLAVSAKLLDRPVILDTASVTFSVPPELGEITPEGVFTMTSDVTAQGAITVTAGGRTVTVPVGIEVTSAFPDISGHWAETPITMLHDYGVVNGNNDGLFHPDDHIRRCDFILMLYRALVGEEAEIDWPAATFTDVPTDAYYYDAVSWAQAIGIANGVGNNKLDPLGDLTREQAFTLIYRMQTLLNVELPAPDPVILEVFPDGADVHDYARDAASVLLAQGVVTGSNGQLLPQNALTRAEMCKILYLVIYA